ncbi:phosphate ABC transporter permease subunit PstC [Megalodesulfovibrio gigas]|uniref:phosphate ABC transporter permease subunit PstC n=1 Tax=Megalodesulfovibrio gigas TaxID=879 RepID=UPI000416800C|nr:phosphate ABC transporter permease subunit PstC [Megalodesulfovibrio gigas]
MDSATLLQYALLGLVPLLLFAYVLGVRRARPMAPGMHFHSAPSYYGWYAVVWVGMPAFGVYGLSLLLRSVGLYDTPALATIAGVLLVAGLGLVYGISRITPELRAIHAVEKTIMRVLLVCSCISVLTTVGIVLSIVFETLQFFKFVSVWEFLTGTTWDPDTAFLQGAGRDGGAVSEAKFGSLPLFAGTFMITGIAMLVAMPVGLLAAIFMSEYASAFARKVSKPTLEILAGIPTVVYGYFAAITVGPLVVHLAESIGLSAVYNNALAPGLVMGVMIIPFVSSLSDDVINAVPQSLREGSMAVGATQSETILRVVLPAAMPGIVSAFLLAVSRAVGETMIVVMAAGLHPNLTANPLESMTTVTVRIVDALIGDQEFNSPLTLSAFALGFVLLVLTLIMNIISLYVVRRFKQHYE